MYRIGDEIGRGALGRVVELHAEDGGRWAGKILHASHRADPRARARFDAEARILAAVRHPNLIEIHGLVEVDGEQVLRMERIDGPDLATLLATEGPLPGDRVVLLARGIAAGLGAAHRAGIIHRDLKPGNVLIAADGTPKIGDFGMARAASFVGIDRDAFAVAGTPDYMAPESVDPRAVDPRTDLYAFGCLLCELVTGAPPYPAATAFAVLEAHRTAPLPALPGVPSGLRRLILWLLAKSPVDRPQSANAVADALAALSPTEALVAADSAHPALQADALPATGRTCASCGVAGLVEIGVCFVCREPQVRVEAGDYTVFITGPGEAASKLDVELRQRLLDWFHANAGAGLDAARLTKDVPRLPFPLVLRVSEPAARALAQAVGRLGFETEVMRGGRFALPAIRSKARTLSGRIAAIIATAAISGIHALGATLVVIGPVLGVVAFFSGYALAGRPAARRTGAARALPTSLAAALDRVAGVVPAIGAERHRSALRGAVERALRLHAVVPADERGRIEPELARLIDLACVATSRVDELERELETADLRELSAAERERWHERDRCAARLLEVTAFLDALRARWVAAGAGTTSASLDDLRARVLALEEVEAT